MTSEHDLILNGWDLWDVPVAIILVIYRHYSEDQMITPTVGRVVWYHPSKFDPLAEHLAAIVVHVWAETMVNLAIFDSNGVAFSRTSVPLWQGEGDRPPVPYCEWMPFQHAQAKKYEGQGVA